jgi:hypothetical protein
MGMDGKKDDSSSSLLSILKEMEEERGDVLMVGAR